MIISSNNVFQPFEHTVNTEKYSVIGLPFECHPTLQMSSSDADGFKYQTQRPKHDPYYKYQL